MARMQQKGRLKMRIIITVDEVDEDYDPDLLDAVIEDVTNGLVDDVRIERD